MQVSRLASYVALCLTENLSLASIPAWLFVVGIHPV